MCTTSPDTFGATPANIKWTVVRGDTAKLKIEFLENDEVTFYDNSEWSYTSTAYDSSGDILDELTVLPNVGYVEILITSDVSANWGTRYNGVSADIPFDLQIFISDTNTTWTPVIGTICVIADVSPGGL